MTTASPRPVPSPSFFVVKRARTPVPWWLSPSRGQCHGPSDSHGNRGEAQGVPEQSSRSRSTSRGRWRGVLRTGASACALFVVRFIRTWCICDASARTNGRSAGTVVCCQVEFAAERGAQEHGTSVTTSPTVDGRRWSSCAGAKARICSVKSVARADALRTCARSDSTRGRGGPRPLQGCLRVTDHGCKKIVEVVGDAGKGPQGLEPLHL